MDFGDFTDISEGSTNLNFVFSSTREVNTTKEKKVEDTKTKICRSCRAPIPVTMSRCWCEFDEGEP
jgi:hypothetical protein